MARQAANPDTPTKLYVVEDSHGDARLVRARTRPQAMAHVAKSEFSTRLASQDDLVAMIGKGIKPELATVAANDDEE
jgi:hypothetical protein